MSMYEWDESLDVGVPAMNAEHQKLISMMDQMFELVNGESTFEQQLAALDGLMGYAVEHFEDEEAYMESIGHPGLEEHRLIHQMLVDKLTRHRGKVVEAEEIPPKFFKFLNFWLISHIKGADSEYGEHAKTIAA